VGKEEEGGGRSKKGGRGAMKTGREERKREGVRRATLSEAR
jgi:hypothetical protein